jgi:radical SAM superfamily enzyme YgiQ (UPF0313 family)
MHVCLVRCPSRFLIDERAFPPLGLMAVGAGLKRAGHAVTLFDGEIEDLPLDYHYYGFGPTTPEYPAAVNCLHRIKQHNPTARVIIGGPHVMLNKTDNVPWDCRVVGDGEFAVVEAFASGVQVVVAPELPLDNYPMPDRTLVDLRKYTATLDGELVSPIMGSRGCPWQCAFCCKNYQKVRLNSAQRIITEIDVLYASGYDAVAFPEDVFVLNPERTIAVAHHLGCRGMIWRCLARADLLVKYGQDFVDILANGGCTGVGIGIESGSDRILKAINKGETTATILKAIGMLKQTGLHVKGFFILGLPGENEESLKETETFLEQAELDDVDCKIFQPYPGSPIYDHREQYDIKWRDIPLENTFYKGVPGLYHGNISTSCLTTERIVEAWKHLDSKFNKVAREVVACG